MAVAYTCDGCNIAVEKPMQVGHVLKRDYCGACALRAEAFLTAEEKLRVDIQAEFQTGRAGLIAFHGEGGFKLPDVA